MVGHYRCYRPRNPSVCKSSGVHLIYSLGHKMTFFTITFPEILFYILMKKNRFGPNSDSDGWRGVNHCGGEGGSQKFSVDWKSIYRSRDLWYMYPASRFWNGFTSRYGLLELAVRPKFPKIIMHANRLFVRWQQLFFLNTASLYQVTWKQHVHLYAISQINIIHEP